MVTSPKTNSHLSIYFYTALYSREVFQQTYVMAISGYALQLSKDGPESVHQPIIKQKEQILSSERRPMTKNIIFVRVPVLLIFFSFFFFHFHQ